MAIGQWSTTAANNATAATNINWQEGQAPSTVNDSARQMMADTAAWYQNAEWLNMSDTPTYVDRTHFTVPGNLTTRYSVGRRVRASVTAGTVYGLITGSVFGSVTTVTVSLDSGSLDNGLSEIDVGILSPTNTSLPAYPAIAISGPSSTIRPLVFQTVGVNRWIIDADSTAESGGTSGSNFQIVSCTDAGNLGTPAMTITRLNNNVTFSASVSAENVTITSDRRLKSRIKRIRNATEIVLSWVGVTFQWKGDKTKRRHAGFIAGDLESSSPYLVYEDEKGIKSVAYGNATAYLAEAFKELEERVRKLEKTK